MIWGAFMKIGAFRIWSTFNDNFGHKLKDNEIVKNPKLQKILGDFLHIKKNEVIESSKIQLRPKFTDVFELSKPNIFQRIGHYFNKRQMKSDSEKVLKTILSRVDREFKEKNSSAAVFGLSVFDVAKEITEKVRWDLSRDRGLWKRFPISEEKIQNVVIAALESSVAQEEHLDEYGLGAKIGKRATEELQKDLIALNELEGDELKERQSEIVEKYLAKDVTFLEFDSLLKMPIPDDEDSDDDDFSFGDQGVAVVKQLNAKPSAAESATIKTEQDFALNEKNAEVITLLLSARLDRDLRVLSLPKNECSEAKRIHAAKSFTETTRQLEDFLIDLDEEDLEESFINALKLANDHFQRIAENYPEIDKFSKRFLVGEVDNSVFHDPRTRRNLVILTELLLKKQLKQIPAVNEDFKEFVDFLESAMGDMKINAQVHKVEVKDIPEGIDKEAVLALATLTFKGMFIKELPALTAKLENLMPKARKNQKIPQEEKLSSRELGQIYSLSALESVLGYLDKIDALEDHPRLKKLAQHAVRLNELTIELDQIFDKEIDETQLFQSGDFGATYEEKFAEQRGKVLDWRDKLIQRFASKSSHGLYVYRSKPVNGVSKVIASELMKEHKSAPLAIHEMGYTDFWRIDVGQLIGKDRERKAALKEIAAKKGIPLSRLVKEIYQESARYIHEDQKENLSRIKNEKRRQIYAGLANYGIVGGHIRIFPRKDRFVNVHGEFTELPSAPSKKKHKMICSEFVSKSTIAALIETDIRLEMLIRKHAKGRLGPQDRTTILKDIEKYGTLNIQIPISSREKLKRVHPDRMIEILLEKGVLNKLPKPRIYMQMVKTR